MEQRRQVAMVDPRARGRGDDRLGAIGGSQPGAADHCQVVGPVAYRERVDWPARGLIVWGAAVHAYGIWAINVLGFVG